VGEGFLSGFNELIGLGVVGGDGADELGWGGQAGVLNEDLGEFGFPVFAGGEPETIGAKVDSEVFAVEDDL